MMKIVFATGNRNKLREVQSLIGDRAQLSTPADHGITEDIPENQPTLEGNALQKARYIYEKTGLNCFADDTGLEVEALGGEPGVFSARYAAVNGAGEGHSSEANMALLLERLKGLVSDKTIDDEDNAMYKELLDRCQYYLAYRTVVEVCMKISYKVGNFGVVKTTDEHVENASSEEIAKKMYYYQSKADGLCYDLQGWILDNSGAFPELDECAYHKISSNLYSAASCGIWLGGPRGRKL